METQSNHASRGATRRACVNKHRRFRRGKLSARYLRQRDALSQPPSPAPASIAELQASDTEEDACAGDYSGDYDCDYDYCDDREAARVAESLDRAWLEAEQQLLAAVPFNALALPHTLSRPRYQDLAPRAQHPRATLEQRIIDHLGALTRAGAGLVSATRPQAQAELEALHHVAYDPSSTRCVRPEIAIALALFQPFWVRSPASWDPAQTPSLIEHLLVEYPVPRFLLGVWRELPKQLDLRFVAWLITVGQGGSLRRLTQLARSSRCHGAWPRLPKKLPGLLAHVPDRLPIIEGLIYAEVLRFGGSEVEFRRIRHDGSYVVDPTTLDPATLAFWSGCIAWLARYRERLTDDGCAGILAWAQHLHIERGDGLARFDWAGRTPEAAQREALEYRRLYTRARYRSFGPARTWDHHGWDWEQQIDAETWSITELVGDHQLLLESRAMSHCVVGYGHRCVAGHCAIFSLRQAGKRCLTIELRLPSRTVVQVRGACNRHPSAAEQMIVDRWANEVVSHGG